MDVLASTKVQDEPLGVKKIAGMCTGDVAYRLTEQALLTINTAQLFRNGFPTDFSLLLLRDLVRVNPAMKLVVMSAISADPWKACGQVSKRFPIPSLRPT